MRRDLFLVRLTRLARGTLLAASIVSPAPALAGPPPTPAPPAGATAVPPAAAASAARPPAPPAARARRPKRPTVETPAVPPAALRLTLETPSLDGPWTLRLENAGAVPLRVLADARLLALEIAPPPLEASAAGADVKTDASQNRRARPARPVRCALPADMRPRDYEERALVIPGGRSYVEKFDPRLFCFGSRAAAALVAGATVVPKLVGSREVPAVAPIEEVEPKVAGAREWVGIASTLVAGVPSAPREPGAPEPVAVTTPAFLDFGLGWEAEMPTTVKNTSSKSVALLLRPETVAFDVTGPSGVGVTDPSPTVRCGWPGPPPVPVPEAYAHLAPKQATSITVLLSALCPDDALVRPGLYVVRARLETRGASGASVGVRTFTGEVLAANATRLRVREWQRSPPAASRPQLADTSAATASVPPAPSAH